jgi:DNA-binding transcriptional regulator YbjK
MFLTKESPTVKRRSKGEKTRLLILQSAIEVLAKNGIKGTTHRAIAKHADIQLSLTTYYFKDIQELVHQAFILCSSQITAKTSLAWQPAIVLFGSVNKTNLRKVSDKENFRDKLSDMITQQLLKNIVESPVQLNVQQLLFTEVQVSPQLHALADMHRKTLIAPYVRLCEFLNSRAPQIDADIMLTVFTQLEYRYLTTPQNELLLEKINATVSRIIGNIMNLKA